MAARVIDALQYKLVAVDRGHIEALYEWDRLEPNRQLYTCRPVKALVDVEEYSDSLQQKITRGELIMYVLVSIERRHLPLGRVRVFDFNARNKSAEFGYYLPSHFRGKGLGGIMLTLFLDQVFSFMDINKVYATTSSGNLRSIRLLERLGFSLDGRLREHYWVGTERFDQLNYSILSREWKRGRPETHGTDFGQADVKFLSSGSYTVAQVGSNSPKGDK